MMGRRGRETKEHANDAELHSIYVMVYIVLGPGMPCGKPSCEFAFGRWYYRERDLQGIFKRIRARPSLHNDTEHVGA